MRFVCKFPVGPYRVALSVGRVTKVTGLNSTLTDGNHIIMWEFDGTDFSPVYRALETIQRRYALPAITIVQSHKGGGFHAYCFTRQPFIRTVHVVSGTPGVDPHFITMCCARRHWTLRVSDKGQGKPYFIMAVQSLIDDESSPQDLAGYVHYETHASKEWFGVDLLRTWKP